ncbi:MAG: neutral zinc metallopeptidase [Anaerolineaceae bacterium]
MPFNEKSRLDPSQVQDRRGRSVGRTVAFGGGGLGLIILVVALLLGVNPNDLSKLVTTDLPASDQTVSEISDLQTECQTGADANTREDCRIVGYVNSIQDYWSTEFASHDVQYTQAQTVLFSGATEAACGYASAASGPFYCQRDQMVYLDLSFFEELKSRFGAEGGPFAEAYVLAHEYGHHIQNLLGILEQTSGNSTGPQSMSVFIELQADCLAGVWAYHAAETGYLTAPTNEEIAQSLDAAAAVGDDRIQRETQGYISPESWTHGSSEQRQAAFMDGIQSGDVNSCDTPGWTE